MHVARGGRFVLGIGLSHQIVIENMFGLSFEKPLRHMREYLSILMPLIQTGAVAFTGETLSAHGDDRRPRLDARARCSSPRSARRCSSSRARVADGTDDLDDRTATRSRRYTVPDDHEGRRGRRPTGAAHRRGHAGLRHRRRRRRPRARREGLPGVRRSSRRTGRCSTVKAPRVRRTSRSSATRPTVKSGIGRLADAGVTDFVAVGVRGGRRTSGRAPGSCSGRCCERRRAAVAARAARGAGDRGGRDRARSPPPRDLHDQRPAHAALARRSAGRARRRHGRRRDGRAARPGRRALPRPRRAASPTQGIGTIRVGYRKPNDLAPLRARRRRRRRPRDAHRREAVRHRRPLVRRRGRVAGRDRARRALRGRRHALDPVGRMRGRRRARRRLPCCCCTAIATRSCRRTRARSCRCSSVTASS